MKYGLVQPRICSSHLLRLENPCCNACFTILLLNISMDMPASQNCSNCTFRHGFLRLATIPTAKSGLERIVATTPIGVDYIVWLSRKLQVNALMKLLTILDSRWSLSRT
jgi:hypothetical protein